MNAPAEVILAEQRKAVNRMEIVDELLAMAQEAFIRDPSRSNEIALKAAIRLGKETAAEAAEWIDV